MAHTIFSRLLALCLGAAGTPEAEDAKATGTGTGTEVIGAIIDVVGLTGSGFTTLFSLASVALRGIRTGWFDSVVDGTVVGSVGSKVHVHVSTVSCHISRRSTTRVASNSFLLNIALVAWVACLLMTQDFGKW